MNAGKSTTLLQSSYNYNERGMDTIIFSPAIDDRFGAKKVQSRIGLACEAIAFDADFDLLAYAKQAIQDNPNIRCILVDEAQFLSKQQVLQLAAITIELHCPVLAYGLRTDFQGEPFEGSMYLLALADQLIEIKTICHCGKKATMNLRVDKDGKAVKTGNQVEIGGNERYVSTCRQHFRLGVGSKSAQEIELSAAEETHI